MAIPQDPVMLLSYLNTQLRDHYANLEALCDDLALSQQELQAKLAAIGCAYDASQNRFV